MARKNCDKDAFDPENLSPEAKRFLNDLDEVAKASAELALDDRTPRVPEDISQLNGSDARPDLCG